MRRTRLSALSLVAFLALACTRGGEQVAGGWTDTDTGTKLSGVVTEEGGAPAVGARVSLRPEDYLAKDPTQPDSTGPRKGAILDAVCDGAGRFEFDSLPAGRYLVEAARDDKGILLPVTVEEGGEDIRVSSAVLRPIVRILGRVAFSDGAPGSALVRVYGMERAVLADPATGRFTIPRIPSGLLALHVAGLEPFIMPVRKSGIQVSAGADADAGEIILQRRLKQAFHVVDGRLEIPGVDSTNPVIFENGAFKNPVDGAYLWAKASLGRLDLRGTIVSYSKDTGEAALARNLDNCRALVDAARASGMRNVVEPVGGARHKLSPAPSGRLEDIQPDHTQGGLLLIQEAYRARPEKPLIVISGAGLSTVAEALLRDPAIANRMVVITANHGTINNMDTLASAVVSKKARLVAWARDYYWDNSGFPRTDPETFPSNRLGEALKAQFAKDTSAAHWSYSFFADFGAATYLFDKSVWKTAVGANLKRAAPSDDIIPAVTPFDFVDIPKAANDWARMHAEFLSAITDPGAYHPWPVGGRLPAGVFSASLRAKVDTVAGSMGPAVLWAGRGSWAEYTLRIDSTGDYGLQLRYRSETPAGLKVTEAASGIEVTLPLLPASGEATAVLPVRLEAGVRTLRIESTRSGFAVEWLQLVAP